MKKGEIQMMKKENGITLMLLAVSVLVMIILIGTGMTAVYTGINEVKDNKLNTELGIVRQAIVEQYALAEAVGKTKVLKEDVPVSFWIGEKIDNGDMIYVPTSGLNAEDENATEFFSRIQDCHPVYQEDFYYRLQKEELQQLGITSEESEYVYIVNYATGEVYNETKKLTSTGNLLYIPSTVFPIDSDGIEENQDFNDWN